MNAESKGHSITLDVNVDTSALEKAVALMERLAAAAQFARDAIATFNGQAIAADDTPRMILAELQGLRGDIAQQAELLNAVGVRTFTA